MKIRHERPEADLAYSVRAPLGLELPDGRQLKVTEWSLAGLVLPDDLDIAPERGVLSIPFQGVDIRFPVKLGAGGAPNERVFEGLTGRQRETLAVFYRSILSGKMAATDEVITALDTPVDLVPMGETDEEKAVGSAGKAPRSLRVVLNVVLYLAFAGAVFGLLGSMIFNKLDGIALQHGRIQAPFHVHLAPDSAYVAKIRVAPGDAVTRGDVLVDLNDPERDGDVERAREDLSEAEARVREARRRWQFHEARRPDARAELEAAYAAAVAARRPADFFGGYDLAAVEAAWMRLRAFDEGISLEPNDFNDIAQQLLELLQDRKDDERRLRRELSNAKDAANSFDILAETDGRVMDVPVFRDQFLRRGQTALTLEADTPRQAVGWVEEDLAATLYVGMTAWVTLTVGAEKRRERAEIVDIVAGVDPARPDAFGLLVTLAFKDQSVDHLRDMFRPNAPVQIELDRDWAKRVRAVFRGAWGAVTGVFEA